MKKFHSTFLLLAVAVTGYAQIGSALQSKVDKMAAAEESKIIAWRRQIHQYPELSNREVKTGAMVAEHLRSLGIEVKTGVAHTGVIGILKGSKPGAVIALRADMDALPVTEQNDLPFASREKTVFNGQETGVMHACGHDAHTAILMGVAEILAKNRADLKGTVKFIFQPAEEGAPAGEEGGASLIVKEGVLDDVDVIFGLHVRAMTPLGKIEYKSGGFMAASDWFTIKVHGRQAHGAAPWKGIDPIVISSQIIQGLQTIISRQTELTKEPAVLTVGRINAGIRENIIPQDAEMAGTIRTFDRDMQTMIHEKVKLTAEKIAESGGATATVTFESKVPVTYNDKELTAKMLPSLVRAAGASNVIQISPDTGSEDFAYYLQKAPGLFFFLGVCPPEIDPAKAPSHHTPDFMMDERGMITGLKAMLNVTLDYMYMAKK